MKNDEQLVKDAVSKFPATFQLRGHEGEFRMSPTSSYVSNGIVLLYTEKLVEGQWLSYVKATQAEMLRYVIF